MPNWRARLRALVAGAVFGFGACTAAGHFVPETMEPFTRFHMFVAPDTFYYPTVRSVWNMVQGRVDHGKTVVVVGGSSLLYGDGQRVGYAFPDALGKELGPGYTILNLAMRGGDVAGMALFMAEVLQGAGYDVYYMADVNWGGTNPIGANPYYEYIYWQYRRESFAQVWAPRDDFAKSRAFGELAFGRRLNAIFRFDNLWNWVSYNYLSTVFTRYTPDFWRPRRSYDDPEIDWPEGVANARLDIDAEMRAVDPGTTPPSTAQLDYAVAMWGATVPDRLKQRTIFVLCRKSPFIVSRYPQEVQDNFAASYDAIEQHARTAGFDAVQPCRDFALRDFNGTTHLTVAGAAKLAIAIAQEIRELQAGRHPDQGVAGH
jgi:hypothetical protein